MKINDFSKKYGISKRHIDYYTNAGLLHPKKYENNYRDYDEKCEEEIKKILIVKAMGKLHDMDKYIKMLDNLPREFIDEIVISSIDKEISRITKFYRLAKEWAKDLH